MYFIQQIDNVDLTETIQHLITLHFDHKYEDICKILKIDYDSNYINKDIQVDKYYNKGMLFCNDDNPTIKVRMSMDQETKYIFKTLLMIMSNIMYERTLIDLMLNRWIKKYGKVGFNNSDIISVGKYSRPSIEIGQKNSKELYVFSKISNLKIEHIFKLSVLSYINDDIMLPLLRENELKFDTHLPKYETKNIEILKDNNYVISDDLDINELMLFIESRINKSNDCWLWTKNMNGNYGKLVFNNNKGLAHRISYIIKHGYIPKDMLVCHKCDNPSCVNPDHLFIGTNLDNTNDALDKGRYGNKIIFDKEQIEEIYKMFDEGLNKTQIADKLGFSTKQIDAVFNHYVYAQKFKTNNQS